MENKKVNFKCDTGAQVNVLSIKDLKKIVDDESPYWSETTVILEAFGGTKIKPMGKRNLTVNIKDQYFKTEFIIIEENVKPILGLKSLIEFNLLKNVDINSITKKDDKNLIINKYCELFQGIGQFEKPLELHTQPGAEPVVRPPRRVPHSILSRLRAN